MTVAPPLSALVIGLVFGGFELGVSWTVFPLHYIRVRLYIYIGPHIEHYFMSVTSNSFKCDISFLISEGGEVVD